MDKEKLVQEFREKLDEWEIAQKGIISPFEYEKKFDELWTELGREVLQGSVGEEKAARKKNYNNEIRENFDSQNPPVEL